MQTWTRLGHLCVLLPCTRRCPVACQPRAPFAPVDDLQALEMSRLVQARGRAGQSVSRAHSIPFVCSLLSQQPTIQRVLIRPVPMFFSWLITD